MPQVNNRKKILYGLAALVLLIAAITIIFITKTSRMVDLQVYQLGAREYLGEGDLYGKNYPTTEISLPFTYPPFGSLMFTVLSVLPLGVATVVLLLISLSCLWFSLGSVFKVFNVPTPWLYGLIAVGPALALEPVRATLFFGQINLILMALVIADVTGAIPKLPRGILIGIAAAIKLTPAYFLIYLVAKLDYKAIGGFFLGFFGATFLAWIFHPATTVEYFTEVLQDTGRIGGAAYAGNVSIAGLNARLADGKIFWLLGAILVTALVFVAARSLIGRHEDFMAVLVVAFGCLCVSPVSWSHHWVWFAPLIVALLLRGNTYLALIGAIIAIISPQWWFPSHHYVELQWNFIQNMLAISYVFYALALIIILFVRPAPRADWIKDVFQIPITR